MRDKKLNFETFKKEALSNPEVKEEYERLKPYYELKKELIKARLEAGLTQEELAKKLNTKKSNIARLESPNYKSSPNLSTIIEYARALGYEIEIKFKKIFQ